MWYSDLLPLISSMSDSRNGGNWRACSSRHFTLFIITHLAVAFYCSMLALGHPIKLTSEAGLETVGEINCVKRSQAHRESSEWPGLKPRIYQL